MPNDAARQRRDIFISEQKISAAARVDLPSFVALMKPDYKFEWANIYILQELQRFILSPKAKNLMILTPPRLGKSEIVSCMLPIFLFGVMSLRILNGGRTPYEMLLLSYSQELAMDFIKKQLHYMTARERGEDGKIKPNPYQQLFPKIRPSPRGQSFGREFKSSGFEYDMVADISRGAKFKEEDGAYRKAGGIVAGAPGTTITGRGADLVIMDDLVKELRDANSRRIKDERWNWYASVVRSRLEFRHGFVGKTVILNTRWAEDDIPGRLLKREPKDWHVIRLPAFAYEKDDPLRDPEDRREPGECVSFRLRDKYLNDKAVMGDSHFSATHQQTPMAEGGNLIKAKDIQYWDSLEGEGFDFKIITADLAYKTGEENDYSVFQLWGLKISDGPARYYLLDQLRDKITYSVARQRLFDFAKSAGDLYGVYIEDGGGDASALQEELSRYIYNLQLWPKRGRDKLIMVQLAQPLFQQKRVYFPEPRKFPWVRNNIDELTIFPNARHDDTVDATTMALETLNREAQEYSSASIMATFNPKDLFRGRRPPPLS